MNISNGSSSAQFEAFSFIDAHGYDRSVCVAPEDVDELIALMDIARFLNDAEFNSLVAEIKRKAKNQ